MTTIITKNGSGAPTAGQLSQGELAVDLTNKELYTKDSGGNVIKVGAQGGSTGTFTDLTATSSFTSPGIDDNATSTAITIASSGLVNLSGSIEATTAYRAYDSVGAAYRNVLRYDNGNVRLETGSNGAEGITAFTSGLERMRITSNGNVGIGTDAPNISGGGAASTFLTVSASGSNANGILELKGTRSAGSVVSYLRSYNNSGATPITDILCYSGPTSPDTTGELAFHTSNSERMRISSAGTTTVTGGFEAAQPGAGANAFAAGNAAGLTSQGASAISIGYAAGTSGQLTQAIAIGKDAGTLNQQPNSIAIGTKAGELNQGANGIIINSSGSAVNSTDAGHIVLRSSAGFLSLNSAANTWTFDGGNVTIPNDDLLVGTTTYGLNGVEGIQVGGNSGPATGLEVTRSGTPVDNKQTAMFQTYGTGIANVGCYKHSGITDPAGYFGATDGNAAFAFLWHNSGTWRTGSSTYIGTASGTVVGTQTSDERLKDIEPSFEYGLDAVMALKPIAYTRNDEDSPVRQLGFGAQTTQAIVPEAVYDTGECLDGYDVDPDDSMVQTAKSDDTKLAMEYVQIVPVLVKAIQEQQAMIETLQAEVAALKGA